MNDTNKPAAYLLDMLIQVRDGMQWNPATMETLPTRIACVYSELREFEDALDEHSGHASEELADVAMYLCCTLHDLWASRWSARSFRTLPSRYQPPGELTRPVRRYLDVSMQAWRRLESPNRLGDACVALELALLEVARLAMTLEIDLEHEIGRKIEILRTRGPRNGGKHPDS